MDKALKLRVDPSVTFGLNTQLKEQLKWLIGTGHLLPGDMLPPAGDLADLLGLNRNTINSVYNQLKDDGLVSIQKGRGTQVLDNTHVKQLRKLREPMHELFMRILDEANSKHIPLNEFFTASLAYLMLQEGEQANRRRILFIECEGHDFPFYQTEIERITGAEVRTHMLSELQSEKIRDEAVARADLVITTLNHDGEVKELLQGYNIRIYVIGAAVAMPVLLEIAQQSSASQVGFVCLGNVGGQWMASRVQEAGIMNITASPLGIENAAELQELVEQSDTVYASSAVFAQVNELAPDKTRLFPMILEKSSERLLYELRQADK
ncbi:GntR family transcriptional regulator [Paenibacillus sp. SN-8-1]|uniref:GntR family transcriptional regulator n=1 Tax=Paenibacillus sp. SN-8-1 TaxID=3435409 RepID=UPI003D9AAEBA